MSDDQAPEGDHPPTARPRPSFLPPLDDAPPPPPIPQVASPPVARSPGRGVAWNLGVIVAGALLLVSAFLPWAQVRIAIDLFGRTLTRELGTVAGLEADNVVVSIPVLAMVAIALAFWGIVGRDTRVSALAAIPGALSLLACALFALRLGDIRDRLAGGDNSFGYEITATGGWYLAVAMSLLITALTLTRPITQKLNHPNRPTRRARANHAAQTKATQTTPSGETGPAEPTRKTGPTT